MNKSANLLTASPGLNPLPVRNNRTISICFLIFAGLVGYILPWVANPGVSLTLGAYDLAEWTSLARDVDMMNTVLLLRLPPVFLVIIAGFAFGYPRFTTRWWLTAFFVLLMTAALLPPIEFLQDTGNTNYRQQLMMAVFAFIGGVIGLTGLLPRFRSFLVTGLSLLAVVVAIVALNQALNFMWDLRLPASTGIGVIIFVITMGVLSAVSRLAAPADA